jgi:hypothetical protein
MTGIDAELFRHRSCRRHLLEDPLLDTALRPPLVAVIDRCMRSILRGAIAPAASGLKDMQDASDHPAIVYARLARFAVPPIGDLDVNALKPFRPASTGATRCGSGK